MKDKNTKNKNLEKSNITEKKNPKKNIPNINLLEILLKYIPHRIHVKDEKGRFVEVSESAVKALGKKKEEVIGKTEFDLFPEEVAKKHLEEEKNIMATGTPMIEREEKIITSDGEEKWVSETKIPRYDKNGNFAGIFEISRDFTKRVREKERAERLNRVLRTIRSINKIISKRQEVNSLIQKSCEAFVEIKGYECAWIVLLDREGSVNFYAGEGLGEDLALILQTVEEKSESNPFIKVLKSSKVHILGCNEVISDTTKAPLFCKSLCSGKFMVTRLHHASSTFGIMGVSLPFDIIDGKEEISLFKEVAEDISFALHTNEEEKERKEFGKALEYKARFENMVLDISTKFINLTPDKISTEIERALWQIGTFADVDRCYLLQFSADGTEIDNEYVWYANGIKQKVEIPVQNILEKLGWAAKKISKAESIYIASVNKLPPEAEKEKRLMLSVGIKSLLLTPLVSSGSVIGCIGFDSLEEEKHWSDEIVYILKITGQIFANALERKAYDDQLSESFQKMQKALEGTVQALSSIIEKKDPYTAGHQNRVAQLALAIGKELGLSEERLEDLRFASLLHDIGKIHVPAEILNKPYSLNKVEMGLIKTHPRIGYEILKSIDFPGPVPEIVLQHHERIDGSGYPDAISSKDILVEAQILGLSDVFESMSSKRPYRAALGIESALKEIEESSGILFAPAVVKACIKVFKERNFSF